MPYVSIILPTYNGSRFIKDAIDSILNQSFEDWELIIVNDCSTDCTPDIIDEYLINDSRIRVIHNEVNQKLPKSLNIGFREAKGELLTWTSDDNMYRENAIEKMVDYLNNNLAEMMVCTRFDFVDDECNYQGTSSEYSNDLMLVNNCVGACFMYRKAVLHEVGEYDANLFLVEDYEYWLRILFKYGNIAYLDENLYIYRNQKGSLTATRMKDIKYNIAKMQLKYLDKIVPKLCDNQEALTKIYFEIERNVGLPTDAQSLIQSKVDLMSMIIETELPEKFIVYGAGEIGRKLCETHYNNIVCFADKNPDKCGQFVEGKEIISLDELKNLSLANQVVIAAGTEKVYDFINTLHQLGIGKCYIYKEGWK